MYLIVDMRLKIIFFVFFFKVQKIHKMEKWRDTYNRK